ncbi:MAG: Ig-like domain-containing protein, partial [Nitrospiria bacterium]
MKKGVLSRSKLIYRLILFAFLSFISGSCAPYPLQSITITPVDPVLNPSGLATTLKPGSTTITATLGSISGSATLTVSAAVLQSITVNPLNPTIPGGLNQQFTATGNYSDGTSHDVTLSVTWNSGTTTVASINPSGLATAVGLANTNSTITA